MFGVAGCANLGEGPTHFWDVPFHCIVCGNLTESALKNWKKRQGIIDGEKISEKTLEMIKIKMSK